MVLCFVLRPMYHIIYYTRSNWTVVLVSVYKLSERTAASFWVIIRIAFRLPMITALHQTTRMFAIFVAAHPLNSPTDMQSSDSQQNSRKATQAQITIIIWQMPCQANVPFGVTCRQRMKLRSFSLIHFVMCKTWLKCWTPNPYARLHRHTLRAEYRVCGMRHMYRCFKVKVNVWHGERPQIRIYVNHVLERWLCILNYIKGKFKSCQLF